LRPSFGGVGLPEIVFASAEQLTGFERKKSKYKEQISQCMLTVRKKISADPLTEQDIQDRKDGITDIKTSDIARTEMSDQAAADGKVKTGEEAFKTWIRDAFKAR